MSNLNKMLDIFNESTKLEVKKIVEITSDKVNVVNLKESSIDEVRKDSIDKGLLTESTGETFKDILDKLISGSYDTDMAEVYDTVNGYTGSTLVVGDKLTDLAIQDFADVLNLPVKSLEKDDGEIYLMLEVPDEEASDRLSKFINIAAGNVGESTYNKYFAEGLNEDYSEEEKIKRTENAKAMFSKLTKEGLTDEEAAKKVASSLIRSEKFMKFIDIPALINTLKESNCINTSEVDECTNNNLKEKCSSKVKKLKENKGFKSVKFKQKVTGLKESDELEDELEQEENPINEDESMLDKQLNELRDILPDLELSLYQIINKEDPEKMIYLVGKTPEGEETSILVQTNVDNTENDPEYSFIPLPTEYDSIIKYTPVYGSEMNPNHEALINYLMQQLVEVNPERAEELNSDTSVPVPEEIDIDSDEDK